MSAPRVGRCPQCSKPSVLEASNPFRPFCCERCKTLDLGDWMSGRFGIPAEEADDASEPAGNPPAQDRRIQ